MGWKNRLLLAALVLTFVMRLSVTYQRPRKRFGVPCVAPFELGIRLALSTVILLAVEIEKSFKRR